MSYIFRTAYEPGDVKSYNNAEYFEPGSSITEPGQVQSIQQILARCVRGEAVPFEKGYYDNEKVTSIDEAFATMDVTQTDGFDLADTGPILADIAQSASSGPTANSHSDTAEQSEAVSGENSDVGPSVSAS